MASIRRGPLAAEAIADPGTGSAPADCGPTVISPAASRAAIEARTTADLRHVDARRPGPIDARPPLMNRDRRRHAGADFLFLRRGSVPRWTRAADAVVQPCSKATRSPSPSAAPTRSAPTAPAALCNRDEETLAATTPPPAEASSRRSTRDEERRDDTERPELRLEPMEIAAQRRQHVGIDRRRRGPLVTPETGRTSTEAETANSGNASRQRQRRRPLVRRVAVRSRRRTRHRLDAFRAGRTGRRRAPPRRAERRAVADPVRPHPLPWPPVDLTVAHDQRRRLAELRVEIPGVRSLPDLQHVTEPRAWSSRPQRAPAFWISVLDRFRGACPRLGDRLRPDARRRQYRAGMPLTTASSGAAGVELAFVWIITPSLRAGQEIGEGPADVDPGPCTRIECICVVCMGCTWVVMRCAWAAPADLAKRREPRSAPARGTAHARHASLHMCSPPPGSAHAA